MLKNILNQHHAILVEGNPLTTIDFIKNELTELGIVIANNPDIIFLSFEKFGIADSRLIIEMANGAPVGESKKRIIFGFNSITIEAQNALLKIFEDPSPQLGFIIVTYSANGMLPTFRSRIQIVGTQNLEKSETEGVEEFINMSIGEKVEEIEKMVKGYKETNDKQSIKNFLLSLHYVFENKLKNNNNPKNVSVLKATAKALDYLDDKSSSVKMLLESVALSIGS
jgi:DNA polymerase III delta prime subunit